MLIILFFLILVLIYKSCVIFVNYVIEKFKIFDKDVIILSLKRSVDRRKNIEKNMKIKFKFFDAVDGMNMDRNILKKYNNKIDYSKLNPGQIGCFISHLLIWESIKNKNTSTIILEDDSEILNDSYEINEEILKDDNFDIIFLGHCAESKGKYLGNDIYESMYPRCTHGYIVTKKGANKLIKLFDDEKIDFPIDEKIGNMIYNKKLISYTIEPEIVKQNGSKSTIM